MDDLLNVAAMAETEAALLGETGADGRHKDAIYRGSHWIHCLNRWYTEKKKKQGVHHDKA